MLEDRTGTSPLCASDEFESPEDQVLRIPIREAEEGPLADRRIVRSRLTPPHSRNARSGKCLSDRRVHGSIEGRIGASARMSGRDDEGIGDLVMVPDRTTTRRPSHQWCRLPTGIRPDLRQVLEVAETQRRDRPAIGPKVRHTRALGDRVQQGLVDRHVGRAVGGRIRKHVAGQTHEDSRRPSTGLPTRSRDIRSSGVGPKTRRSGQTSSGPRPEARNFLE